MRDANPFLNWVVPAITSRTVRIFKSIQFFTITLGVGVATGTATITATTVGNTLVFALGGYANSAPSGQAALSYTNSTTVTATRSSTPDAGVFNGVAVELW